MSTAAAAAAGSAGAGTGSTGTAGTTTTTSTTTTRTSTTTSTTTTSRSHRERRAARYWSRRAHSFRLGTRRWLTVIHGAPPALRPAPRRLASAYSVSRLRRLAHRWWRREHAAWRRANHPPDLPAWMCIHHYEGSWTDPNAPYWGGLQMDYSFQRTYGSWLLRHRGTADHWSPLEQIWVAVRAWRVRGFAPWPNTSRYCGV